MVRVPTNFSLQNLKNFQQQNSLWKSKFKDQILQITHLLVINTPHVIRIHEHIPLHSSDVKQLPFQDYNFINQTKYEALWPYSHSQGWLSSLIKQQQQQKL